MKLISRIHVILIIFLFFIGYITTTLPYNLYYKSWFGYFIIIILFMVLVIFPCVYMYSEFKKTIYAFLLMLLYTSLVSLVILLPTYIIMEGYHFIIGEKIIKRDKDYLYTKEQVWLESCDQITKYESVNILFYKEVSTDEVCDII